MMADERDSADLFLKYNVFNAFDAKPSYQMDEEETRRLGLLIEEVRVESSRSGDFAHTE